MRIDCPCARTSTATAQRRKATSASAPDRPLTLRRRFIGCDHHAAVRRLVPGEAKRDGCAIGEQASPGSQYQGVDQQDVPIHQVALYERLDEQTAAEYYDVFFQIFLQLSYCVR